ncbi:MAG: tetraacyldisaccharide 4'-kinase, partial [Bdellovibrionales bacterium]|nr:tetraacyldisaccharide 4'-kinase [Bdellovibrionales bacterium]
MNIFKYLLLPFSLLFGCVVYVRNWMYDFKILKTYKVEVPVISVGNISVGGSGKTPYILKLICLLQEKGLRPAVIYRGYKRTGTVDCEKVDISSKPASHFGDEASLVAFKAKVPVYVSANRVLAAQKIMKDETVDVILLDDGFQHRRLHRDLDIVVLDATDTCANYILMPVGRGREPLSSLKRAGMLAKHKINLANQMPSLLTDIESSIIFNGLVKLEDWVRGNYNFVDPRGDKVTLVSGVAKPKQVSLSLHEKYPNLIVSEKHFSDHHHFRDSDIPKSEVVTTEKDAIKIKDLKIDTSSV